MKNFKSAILYFIDKLKQSKNFTFSKYADGELKILKNENINLLDKCNGEFQYVPGKDLSEHSRALLLKSYQFKHDNYFVGIGCACCIGNSDFTLMKDLSQQDEAHLTWANVFVNSNYIIFKNEIIPIFLEKNIILVHNAKADIKKLPFYKNIKKDFTIGTNAWINDLILVEKIKEYIKSNNIKNYVFLFAAGPFGNILAYELTKFCADNTYIDIGSTLDPYMGLGKTRRYHRQDGITLSKVCIWGEIKNNPIKQKQKATKQTIITPIKKCTSVVKPKSVIIKAKTPLKKITPPVSTYISEQVTFACVLKRSTTYTEKYVNILYNMVKRNYTKPFIFICLTNEPSNLFLEGIEIRKLIHIEREGWWNKIELFRPGLFDTEKIIYIDLDTVILRNINNIDNFKTFAAIKPWNIKSINLRYLCSGIMCFINGAFDFIYNEFSYSPEILRRFRGGDQNFIAKLLLKHNKSYQDIKNMVKLKSYKIEYMRGEKDADIVCFHGLPRPHQLPNVDIIKTYWR